MKRNPLLLAASLALLPLAGCNVMTNMTTAKGTFHVAVKNESAQPIRIGLTKNGPPFEADFAGPEHVAMSNPKRGDGGTWGALVLPGQTATLPEITGRFNDGVYAFVRVYANDPTLSDMLAIGRHSPNRLDLPLDAGFNRFIVFDQGNQLAARKLPPPPPTTQPKGK